MAEAPKIVVLGAGSVGCFIGGAWHGAGCDISFIGRDRIAADVARHGMRLSDLNGWKRHFETSEIHYSTKPAALAKADIVLLCVKSQATQEAARQIALHAKRKPVVISFQNGISNAEILRKLLPKNQIVQGVVPFNIAYLGEGHWHKSVAGALLVDDVQAVRLLTASIREGPTALHSTGDIQNIAWGKLLINLNNAINALSGDTLLGELSIRDYRRVLAASMLEALDLLKTAGMNPAKLGPLPPQLLPHAIAAPDFIFKNIFLRIHKIDAMARSSMLDDLEAGHPTEVDYLNGEVVRLAATLGKKAPVNAAILALVKQAEAGVERRWNAADLRRHVLEGGHATPLFGY